jgi:hypothetical protein
MNTVIQHNAHNAQMANDFGPEKYRVHHDGVVSTWGVNNREHLDLLLRIEKNLGYIGSIDKIVVQE